MGRRPRAAPPAAAANALRQPQLYWQQLQQLKAAAVCMRLYRNRVGRWVRLVEVVKAVASSGAIAGWVVWKDIPLVWSAIIAAAQLLDALKTVFPFTRMHKAAGDLTVALELLSIDAEQEWESIHAGRRSADAIVKARTRLRKLQLGEERRYFPEGLEFPAELVVLAAKETSDYFRLTYSGEAAHG